MREPGNQGTLGVVLLLLGFMAWVVIEVGRYIGLF